MNTKKVRKKFINKNNLVKKLNIEIFRILHKIFKKNIKKYLLRL